MKILLDFGQIVKSFFFLIDPINMFELLSWVFEIQQMKFDLSVLCYLFLKEIW